TRLEIRTVRSKSTKSAQAGAGHIPPLGHLPFTRGCTCSQTVKFSMRALQPTHAYSIHPPRAGPMLHPRNMPIGEPTVRRSYSRSRLRTITIHAFSFWVAVIPL